MVDKIKQALNQIMVSDEIDKLINHTHGKERRHLKKLKREYRELGADALRLSIVPLMMYIKSEMLFRDLLCYMLLNEGKNEQE